MFRTLALSHSRTLALSHSRTLAISQSRNERGLLRAELVNEVLLGITFLRRITTNHVDRLVFAECLEIVLSH